MMSRGLKCVQMALQRRTEMEQASEKDGSVSGE